MIQDKIKLVDEMRSELRSIRNYVNLSAENVSVEIGRAKGWLAQIERGTVLSIKNDDLYNLLNLYGNKTVDLSVHKKIQRLRNKIEPVEKATEACMDVKECFKCPLLISDYPVCNYTGKLIDRMGEWTDGFPTECPLLKTTIQIRKEE